MSSCHIALDSSFARRRKTKVNYSDLTCEDTFDHSVTSYCPDKPEDMLPIDISDTQPDSPVEVSLSFLDLYDLHIENQNKSFSNAQAADKDNGISDDVSNSCFRVTSNDTDFFPSSNWENLKDGLDESSELCDKTNQLNIDKANDDDSGDARVAIRIDEVVDLNRVFKKKLFVSCKKLDIDDYCKQHRFVKQDPTTVLLKPIAKVEVKQRNSELPETSSKKNQCSDGVPNLVNLSPHPTIVRACPASYKPTMVNLINPISGNKTFSKLAGKSLAHKQYTLTSFERDKVDVIKNNLFPVITQEASSPFQKHKSPIETSFIANINGEIIVDTKDFSAAFPNAVFRHSLDDEPVDVIGMSNDLSDLGKSNHLDEGSVQSTNTKLIPHIEGSIETTQKDRPQLSSFQLTKYERDMKSLSCNRHLVNVQKTKPPPLLNSPKFRTISLSPRINTTVKCQGIDREKPFSPLSQRTKLELPANHSSSGNIINAVSKNIFDIQKEMEQVMSSARTPKVSPVKKHPSPHARMKWNQSKALNTAFRNTNAMLEPNNMNFGCSMYNAGLDLLFGSSDNFDVGLVDVELETTPMSTEEVDVSQHWHDVTPKESPKKSVLHSRSTKENVKSGKSGNSKQKVFAKAKDKLSYKYSNQPAFSTMKIKMQSAMNKKSSKNKKLPKVIAKSLKYSKKAKKFAIKVGVKSKSAGVMMDLNSEVNLILTSALKQKENVETDKEQYKQPPLKQQKSDAKSEPISNLIINLKNMTSSLSHETRDSPTKKDTLPSAKSEIVVTNRCKKRLNKQKVNDDDAKDFNPSVLQSNFASRSSEFESDPAIGTPNTSSSQKVKCEDKSVDSQTHRTSVRLKQRKSSENTTNSNSMLKNHKVRKHKDGSCWVAREMETHLKDINSVHNEPSEIQSNSVSNSFVSDEGTEADLLDIKVIASNDLINDEIQEPTVDTPLPSNDLAIEEIQETSLQSQNSTDAHDSLCKEGKNNYSKNSLPSFETVIHETDSHTIKTKLPLKESSFSENVQKSVDNVTTQSSGSSSDAVTQESSNSKMDIGDKIESIYPNDHFSSEVQEKPDDTINLHPASGDDVQDKYCLTTNENPAQNVDATIHNKDEGMGLSPLAINETKLKPGVKSKSDKDIDSNKTIKKTSQSKITLDRKGTKRESISQESTKKSETSVIPKSKHPEEIVCSPPSCPESAMEKQSPCVISKPTTESLQPLEEVQTPSLDISKTEPGSHSNPKRTLRGRDPDTNKMSKKTSKSKIVLDRKGTKRKSISLESMKKSETSAIPNSKHPEKIACSSPLCPDTTMEKVISKPTEGSLQPLEVQTPALDISESEPGNHSTPKRTPREKDPGSNKKTEQSKITLHRKGTKRKTTSQESMKKSETSVIPKSKHPEKIVCSPPSCPDCTIEKQSPSVIFRPTEESLQPLEEVQTPSLDISKTEPGSHSTPKRTLREKDPDSNKRSKKTDQSKITLDSKSTKRKPPSKESMKKSETSAIPKSKDPEEIVCSPLSRLDSTEEKECPSVISKPTEGSHQPLEEVQTPVLDISKTEPKSHSAQKRTPREKVKCRPFTPPEDVHVKSGKVVTPALEVPSSSNANRPSKSKAYSQEEVIKPFKLGWMREVVHRAVTDKKNKVAVDIYYFTPEGSKLRSMPDVNKYLSDHKSELAIDNFTFVRKTIYREPFEKERDAHARAYNPTPSKVVEPAKVDHPPKQDSPAEKKRKAPIKLKPEKTLRVKISCPIKKPKPKEVDKSLDDTPLAKSNKKQDSESPDKPRKLSLSGTARKSIKQPKEPLEVFPSVDIENDVQKLRNSVPAKEQPILQGPTPAKRLRVSSKKIAIPFPRPCSSRCANALQQQPTVECVSCLCLFHPQCVQGHDWSTDFICSLCKLSAVGKETSSEVQDSFKVQSGNAVVSPEPEVNLNLAAPLLSTKGIVNWKETRIPPPPPLRKAPNRRAVIPMGMPDSKSPIPPLSAQNTTLIAALQTSNTFHSSSTSYPFTPKHSGMVPSGHMPILNYHLTNPILNAEPHFPTSLETNSDPLQKMNSVCERYLHASEVHTFPGMHDTLRNSVGDYAPRFMQCTKTPLRIYPSSINHTISSAHSGIYTSPQQPFQFVLAPRAALPFSNILRAVSTFSGSLPPLNQPSMASVAGCSNYEPTSSSVKFVPLSQTSVMNAKKSETVSSASEVRTVHPIKIIRQKDSIYAATKKISSKEMKPISSSSSSSSSSSTSSDSDSDDHISHLSVVKSPLKKKRYERTNPLVGNVKEVLPNSNTNRPCSIGKKGSSATQKTLPSTSTAAVDSQRDSEQESCMSSLMHSYKCLNLIFQQLNFTDLLKVAQVCQCWRDVASQQFLWDSLSFQNIHISDWKKCSKALKMYGTRILNLHGMHLYTSGSSWKEFAKSSHNLSSVEYLTVDKVPLTALKAIIHNMPLLQCLECYCLTASFKRPDMWNTTCKLEFGDLQHLRKLEKLKIRSAGGIVCGDSPSVLKNMLHLNSLSLTTLKGLKGRHFNFISSMEKLVSLELGDCDFWTTENYLALGKLVNLEHLRLENGGGMEIVLAKSLMKMRRLKELILMNFVIPLSLKLAFDKLSSLSFVSLWPNMQINGAQVNYNTYEAAKHLQNATYFCWGILSNEETIPRLPLLKKSAESEKYETENVCYDILFEELCDLQPNTTVEMKFVSYSFLKEYCTIPC